MKEECPYCKQQVTVTRRGRFRKHYKDSRYICAGSKLPVYLIDDMKLLIDNYQESH